MADLRLTPRLGCCARNGQGSISRRSFRSSFRRRAPGAVERRHGARRGLLALGRRLGEVPAGALDLLANAYVRVRPRATSST